MKIAAIDVEEYIGQLPPERASAITKLRALAKENLPNGFEEQMSYGMPGFVIPHSIYPDGYHCDPKLPLPFLSFASQKNFVAIYHMGIYADPKIMDWFVEEYPKHMNTKLDMGKSCIRFKKPEKIPYNLLAELFKKQSPEDMIELYEKATKKR